MMIAKWLANYLSTLAKDPNDTSAQSFKFSYRGSMAYVGDYQVPHFSLLDLNCSQSTTL
jgi:hypothetical protein